MYKKDGRILFSISSVILIDIVLISIFNIIYICIDPNFSLGIIDSRIGLTLLHLPYPVCILNILLIALYWEELLKKSTKATSFLVKYSKVYIIACIIILSGHIVLIVLSLSVDFTLFATVTTILDFATVIPASISALYCIVNSIRVLVMIKEMDQKLINKNDRKTKLDRTMLFIYVSNFGLMLIVVARLLDISPFYWNYKSDLNQVQYTFSVLGTIICHLGVIFSFHTTRDSGSSSASIKKKSSKSTKDKDRG